MRHVMSCIVLRFHKNKYRAACNFLTNHRGECYLRQSESLLWAGWGQDTPDFLADRWKEIAMISCHFRARKCSTIRLERSNPQSVSLLLPPWNKSLNRCHWKPRLENRETNSLTVSGLKACELQVNSGLIIIRQARDGLAYYQWEGQMRPNRIFFPGFSRACVHVSKKDLLNFWVCSRTYAGTSTDKVYKQWKRSVIAFCLQKLRVIIDRPAGSAISATLDNGIKNVLGWATRLQGPVRV